MSNILSNMATSDQQVTLDNAALINGLHVYYDFISTEEENTLLNNIDRNIWLNDLKRRVQHYGYKYDYKSRRIDHSYYIGEIPEWLKFIKDRLIERGMIDFNPDQAIINEYIDNQGITAHIDCEPCFGDTVISLSLNGQCVLNFQRKSNNKDTEKIPLLLLPRTLIVMTKESRYEWCHGISNRKSDYFNGNTHKRERRVSITFRKVIFTV